MLSTSLRRRLLTAAFCSLFVVSLGCASPPSPGVCAAIGGVLGGGGGYAIGDSTPHSNSDEEAIYGGAGLILGASAGYLICRAMQPEEEAPPPPPPPPPAPEPRAAPPAPPVDEKIILRGVNFDFDKSDIRADAAVILDEAASILNANPGKAVRVEGHTDSIGTDVYNQGLSERRAASVKDYLAGQGVDGTRLSTAGFGESNPIAANDTQDGRALNRRVELNLD
ncbi:MAG: OmpA family protein [Myxococcota bacterium]